MRLATVVVGGRTVPVAGVDGGEAHDITALTGGDLVRALSPEGSRALRGQDLRELPAVDLTDATWLPPVPRPERILCVGLNYATHAQEVARAGSGRPGLFIRFASSFVGHQTPVERPAVSDTLDWEGEIAVVIGAGGRDIPISAAMSHVGGYTVMAENSVREFQDHSRQVTAGKNFDASGSWGPWIVTADEVPDPSALRVRTSLNGAVKQDGSLADLIFGVDALIAYASSFTGLATGDVIATGTPAGVGVREVPPRFLRPGDELVVEMPGLLRLVNPVRDQRAASAHPA